MLNILNNMAFDFKTFGNTDETKYNSPLTTKPQASSSGGIGGLIGADIKIAKAIYNAPKNIVNALSKNEQELGADIGQRLSMRIPTALGGTKGVVDPIVAQYLDNGKRALQMARKETDPTRKAKLVAMAQSNFDESGATFSQIYPVLDKTDLQLIGDVGAVALDVLSAVNLAKVGGSVAGTTAVGFARGATQGAVKGALAGGITGAGQGLVGALQEGKTGKDIYKQIGKEAIIGGITGGVLGGVTGGISGKLNARDIEKQKNAIKAITLDPTQMRDKDLERARGLGMSTPRSGLKPETIEPYNYDKKLAITYSDYLQGSDPVRHVDNLGKAIRKTDESVGEFLKTNPIEIKKENLKWKLTNAVSKIEDSRIPNLSLYKKQRNAYIQSFIDKLPDTGGVGITNDFETFIERKNLDKLADKAGVFDGIPTLKKQLQWATRDAIQDYIESLRPNSTFYANAMSRESEMIRLADIINKKAKSEKGLNAIGVWIKHNPNAAKAIRWAIGFTAAGSVGKRVLSGN